MAKTASKEPKAPRKKSIKKAAPVKPITPVDGDGIIDTPKEILQEVVNQGLGLLHRFIDNRFFRP